MNKQALRGLPYIFRGITMKSVADNWKDLFESKGCISMILYLRENGPAMKNDIYSNVSRNSSMPARIDALEDMGVVSTVILGRCTYVSLTEAGQTVADHLAGIESILDGIE